MQRLLFVFCGALFGWFLSRARATDFAAIRGMFVLGDLHLFGVIGVAIATAAIGLALVRGRKSASGAPIELARKPWAPGILLGGVVFGVGWALSGACPGTALVQLGEGKARALATVAGILAGTWWQRRASSRASTIGSASAAPR